MSRNVVSNDLLIVRKWEQWPSTTRTGNDAFAFSATVRDLVPSDFPGDAWQYVQALLMRQGLILESA